MVQQDYTERGATGGISCLLSVALLQLVIWLVIIVGHMEGMYWLLYPFWIDIPNRMTVTLLVLIPPSLHTLY